MAEGQDRQDKTEPATPRRREQATKEQGAPVSQEVGIATSLLVLMMTVGWLLPALGPTFLEGFRSLMRDIDLVAADGHRRLLDRLMVVEVLRDVQLRLAAVVGPVAFPALVAGVGVSLAQAGLRFTPDRIAFKPNRLNPLNWFKKIFSWQFFMSLGQSLVKGFGVVSLAGFTLRAEPWQLWKLAFAGPAALPVHMRDMVLSVLYVVTAAMVLLAIGDYAWTVFRREQDIRMSREEVKREMKEDGGDPQIKGERRRRQKELLKGKSLPDRMKEATVVTTNPTHYAVALRYWPGRDSKPVVLAKGKDFRAAKIRALAREHGVPIVEDKPLARALYALVKEDRPIPEELFQAVAKLLAIVYRRREGLA